MAISSTVERLRGLVLSAFELRNMMRWPETMIEDYLSLFDSILSLAQDIDTGSSLDVQSIDDDYTIQQNDGTILVSGNSKSVTVFFPLTHVAGQEHNIKIVDETFPCYVDPNGNDLDGDSDIFQMYLHESLRVRSDGAKFWIL